jgi:hypothetical protein
MTREEAMAVCFANLKGTRHKDLLKTARALQYLKSLPEYGSNEKVGRAVGVSGEMVREFLVLLRLPEQVQRLLEQRQLTLEQGRRLWQLGRQRPELLQAAADAMTDLSAIEGRHLVDYLLQHPELSVAEAKQRILESKTITEREFHVIAILDEPGYRELQRQSKQRKLAISELVTEIVRNWLQVSGAHE